MFTHQLIYKTSRIYTWLREPLLRRLPDGSLCCVFFTGGTGDGDLKNIVAAIRSDDGKIWTDAEVLVSLPDQSAWAPSMVVCKGKAHIFWFASSDHYRYFKKNHILSTGEDGRSFVQDREIEDSWITDRGVDVRHGTLLRSGRFLLPISWHEPVKEFNVDDRISPDLSKKFGNFGGLTAVNNRYCCGVMEPNDDFTVFTPYGKIVNSKDKPFPEIGSVPLFEPAIAELSDGSVALLIRGDGTNRLWRADSSDGGRTWRAAYRTDIPNPGSKPRIINLPDGRIVLFHNPNEKDYTDLKSHGHKYRTPLEMWVSNNDMKSWYRKETLIASPRLAQYPDGFYDKETNLIYLVWEDDHHIYLTKISLQEH